MKCLMDHIVLNVEDVEKMIAFYSEVLMLASERLEEYRTGKVLFPSVRLNSDTIIDLFPKKMWQKSTRSEQGLGNLNHLCVALKKGEWDSLLVRLEAKNVVMEEGPVPRWGAHGNGTSIYFRDPEGNLIEARYYEGHKGSEKCLLGSEAAKEGSPIKGVVKGKHTSPARKTRVTLYRLRCQQVNVLARFAPGISTERARMISFC